jgi:hypothetical protein
MSSWKPTPRVTHTLSIIAAVLISSSVLGAVVFGLAGAPEGFTPEWIGAGPM